MLIYVIFHVYITKHICDKATNGETDRRYQQSLDSTKKVLEVREPS